MYRLGYDIGSSFIKTALIEADSCKTIALVKEPQKEIIIQAKQEGWAEQNPNEWWQYVCLGTKKILKKTKIDPQKIISIGIAYQMHGLVLIDEQGELLRPSIIWCDSRAVKIGEAAFKSIGEGKCIQELLNSPANFTAAKLKWVQVNEPAIYERIDKIMLPGDYIAFKLSGEVTTTISGLSEGIFWDFKKNEIAKSLLKEFNFSQAFFPPVKNSFSFHGKVNRKGAQATGLASNTPIHYKAGDQPNNALALGVLEPGEVAATGGTSGVIYAITESKKTKEHTKINHFAHINYSPKNIRLGKLLNINGAGSAFRWAGQLTGENNYEKIATMAEKIDAGSNGLRCFPFGNGAERMLDNQDVGAQIINAQFNQHQATHFYRATLEGIAFAFAFGMEIISKDGVKLNTIKTGNDNLFLAKVFAETLANLNNISIEIYNTTGALGAAKASKYNELENFLSDNSQKIVNQNDRVAVIYPQKDNNEIKNIYEDWKERLSSFC